MVSNEASEKPPATATEVRTMQPDTEETKGETKPEADDTQYAHGIRVVYIIVGLSLAVFCMGLVSLATEQSSMLES